MKNNTRIEKYTFTTVGIGILIASSLSMAATYDIQDQQGNILNNLEQITPLDNELESSSSFLESLEQAKKNKKKSNYLEVLSLIKQNKLEDAENKISALLKEAPNEPGFHNLQALLEVLKKDTSAAQKSYEKSIELDPKNILAHLGLAKLALDDGQLDKAKEYANKSLTINDKVIKAYLLLADVAYKQKDNAEVEKVLLTAQERAKGNVETEVEVNNSLGKFYGVQKQPERILIISEELVKRYPNNSKVLSALAGAQIVNNKKPAAEKTLRQIVSQESQDVNARLMLARLLSEHPDKDKEVINLLDETARISPDKPEALIFKAAYLIKLKRNQEALELAATIDKQFPKLVFGKLLKGDVYLAEKKLDKAAEMYQQAYEMQPNDRVLFTLADMMTAQGKQPDAIKLLNNALEKNNKNVGVHFKLATAYQQQNDNKEAERHYKAILNEQPDNVLALNNLAFLYFQQNNPQALELAKKAYDKAPESAAILDTYGYILIKQGQHKEGLAILEKAASLAPSVNDIQFHLAEAYSSNDNQKKAIEILETIVKAEKGFSEKNAAVSLLDKLKTR